MRVVICPEIEVSPGALPPLPQLFDDIAQMGPTILPNPFRRRYLLPGSVIVQMLVVGVGVSFA